MHRSLLPLLVPGAALTFGCARGEKPEPLAVRVYAECQRAVRQQLVSPGSAVFPAESDPEIQVTLGETGAYGTVEGYVDSHNRYGALLRTEYSCFVDREKGTTSASLMPTVPDPVDDLSATSQTPKVIAPSGY